MKVLLLGANGMLGPHVIKALEGRYQLRATDINDPPPGFGHEYRKVDVSSLEQVMAAAEGMDAIVNLSVLRLDRKLAFDVNTMGCYTTMTAAVKHGIRRVINTGPHFTIAGPSYEEYDYGLNEEMPSQSGSQLYALTKSVGQEMCRVFTESHDVFVLTLLFYNFRYPDDGRGAHQDLTPFTVSWSDAAAAFPLALDIPLEKLPSRCEVFNVFADLPHGKFSNEKAKRILGWKPTHLFEQYWRKARG